MKALALTLMMTVLMFTTSTQADYTINRFAVYEGSGDQEMPDIDNDVVVWQSNGTDICFKQLGDPNAPNVKDSGGAQTYPAVSGDIVVWYDSHTFESATQKDIYGYNLYSQADLFVTYNDGVKQWYPDISGNIVVYEHLDGAYNIYAYNIDLNSSELIEESSAHQLRPAIDGDYLVWMDGRSDGFDGFDIYMCDLSKKPYVTSVVSASDGDQWDPAISGRVIVWREDPGDGSGLNIYGYDLDDPGTGTFPICTVSGDQEYPAISGNIVAWQDDADDDGSYDIWAIDLADMGAGAFEVSDGTGDNRSPSVSGNTIVWQHNGDIHGARLLVPSTVTVTSPNGGEVVEAATSMTINWTYTGPVDEVLIEFSSDNGVNWTDVNTVANTGSYFWNPIADVDSTNCLIAVTNVADVTASDESDAVFEIYRIPNSITITTPNGSEQFLAGSEMDITWTTVGDIDNVMIEFSSNNTVVWDTVIASTPNDGQFSWDSVPDIDSQLCSIRISDTADAATKDVSNDPFTVFQCDAELTADLTGDCFVDMSDFAKMAAQWLLCGNIDDPAWCARQ